VKREILGIHHVTAIAGDPQKNLDFYGGVLGLRLVKLTVNFDDPGTYHLYYGDGAGHPGTILTFFPWPNAPKGRRGTGQVTETAFAIPESAVSYWTERLAERGIAFEGPFERFGEQVISVSDPDGLTIELIATKVVRDDRAWQAGPVPLEFAIRGFHSATLRESDQAATAGLLTDTMGFHLVGQEGNRYRYAVESGEACAGRTIRAGAGGVGPPHRVEDAGRCATTGLAARTVAVGLRRVAGDGSEIFPLDLL
jgi:glyoxalase family protein